MAEPEYEISVAELESMAAPSEGVRNLGEEIDLPAAEDLEELQASAAGAHGPAAVAIARGQLGVQESGGANRGVPYERYVKYFGSGLPPSRWCAFFVSWCFAQSGFRPPWPNPGYVPSIHSWAQANGKLVSAPAHGDLFGVGGEHIGFVAGANTAQKQIFTCEGNYSDKVGSRLVSYASGGFWFARI
jgi:hypothetical protein